MGVARPWEVTGGEVEDLREARDNTVEGEERGGERQWGQPASPSRPWPLADVRGLSCKCACLCAMIYGLGRGHLPIGSPRRRLLSHALLFFLCYSFHLILILYHMISSRIHYFSVLIRFSRPFLYLACILYISSHVDAFLVLRKKLRYHVCSSLRSVLFSPGVPGSEFMACLYS